MSLPSLGQPWIGEAPTTLATNLAAKKIHAVLNRRRGFPLLFDEDEILGENVEVYLSIITQLVAKTPIPVNHNFDADLNSTNACNHCCCVISTILQYIGQWLKNIQYWFLYHPDFEGLADDKFPSWYT